MWNPVGGIDIYKLTNQVTPRLTYIWPLHVHIRINRTAQVHFDFDGTTAVAGGDNGQVLTWDLASGKPTQPLAHGQGQLLVLFFGSRKLTQPVQRTSSRPSRCCQSYSLHPFVTC